MSTTKSGSDMSAPPMRMSGRYTAPSASAASAARRPQSCAAMSPISATASVPMNAWTIRAGGTRSSTPSRATPATSYTPASRKV